MRRQGGSGSRDHNILCFHNTADANDDAVDDKFQSVLLLGGDCIFL